MREAGTDFVLRKTGKLENWKTGKLENWKTGKLENWKTGKLEIVCRADGHVNPYDAVILKSEARASWGSLSASR